MVRHAACGRSEIGSCPEVEYGETLIDGITHCRAQNQTSSHYSQVVYLNKWMMETTKPFSPG